MRKITFSLSIVLLMFFLSVKSQTVPTRDYLQQAFDQVFSNVNKTYINTGYLHEKTYHTMDLLKYNGVEDVSLTSEPSFM